MTLNAKIKNKADILFWYFECNLFQNTGNYSRKTNLVLAFYDFVENATYYELKKIIPLSSQQEFLQLKKMINQGIDVWLDAGDIKTLFLSS